MTTQERLMDIFRKSVEMGASDIMIVPDSPVMIKASGVLNRYGTEPLSDAESNELVRGLFAMADDRSMRRLLELGDDDFAINIPGLVRFRVNTFKQQGVTSSVLRLIPNAMPDPVKLGIPQKILDLYDLKRGIVLVTGPTGSGKTTTLAAIIDRMNHNLPHHIITIEDPIEFVHKNDKSIVSQREVGRDTQTFESALRVALRQAPNAILVGEMRDYETISIAVTAAETGQYVLSTLHTVGAANTIDRIIDIFPPNQQPQIRVQLSMTIQAVVSQQLIPKIGGGATVAFEIMLANNAIRNQIREGKTHQISNSIFTGREQGMILMDDSLLNLYNSGKITAENCYLYAMDKENMKLRLGQAGRFLK